MTVNETRRKKREAISPSQPTLTESEGNWRCQGVCLQNLERAVGVVERAAPRPLFLAGKATYDSRGAVETTHPFQEDTCSLFQDTEEAGIILLPLGKVTLPWS